MIDYTIVYRYGKKYLVESILIALALMITIASFVLYLKEVRATDTYENQPSGIPLPESSIPHPDSSLQLPSVLAVDVSGAVVFPDVYEVSPGARLADVIEKAGGLTDAVDASFVARNYNMSKLVGDQEKIYIPYTWDITNGTFIEEKRVLEYLSPLYGLSAQNEYGLSALSPNNISLNTASLEELDTLPGVGQVTAQKIVDNRPYTTTDELLSKKVVNQSTFDKIQEFITP